MTDFPLTPTVGDQHTYAGIKYEWDGSKWIIITGSLFQKKNTSLNGNIDLSKGLYHKLSTNTGEEITFSSIPIGSSKWSLELDINTTSKYDIAFASGKAAVASFGLSGSTYQFHFSPDGSRFFIADTGTDLISAYILSTPWNITTASLLSTLSVATYDSTIVGITFDPAGKYMYLSGATNHKIFQFELAERWDITTAVLTVGELNATSVSAYSGPYNIKFKPDGTKMYILAWPDSTARRIYEYILNVPWDLSGGVSSPTFVSVAAQDTDAIAFDISNDGKELFMIGTTNDVVYRYTMSTPWSISTATYSSITFTQAATAEAIPSGLQFNPDGSRMFLSGQNLDLMKEYVTTTNYKDYSGAFTFPANVRWDSGIAPTISAKDTKILDFYSPDSGATIYGKQRFTTNKLPKLGLTPALWSVSTSTVGYVSSTNISNIDLSRYANRDVRLVFAYKIILTSANTPQIYIDPINFNGSVYSFESTAHDFYTTTTPTGLYSNIGTTSLLSVNAGGIFDRWNVITTGGSTGTHALYMLGATTTAGNIFWVRSPVVTLNSSPNLSFNFSKPNSGGTQLLVYLDVLN